MAVSRKGYGELGKVVGGCVLNLMLFFYFSTPLQVDDLTIVVGHLDWIVFIVEC